MKFLKTKAATYILTLLILLSLILIPQTIRAANGITIYVVPAITDAKILPAASVSSAYLSSKISLTASPGEYEPASFVVQAQQNIFALLAQPTSLTGPAGSIPSSSIDIHVVKSWYQAGFEDGMLGNFGVTGRFLTPELLLKDDSLISITGEDWSRYNVSNSNGKDYLKLNNGSYVDVSGNWKSVTGETIVPISTRPVSDAAVLQPVDIPSGYNQQYWVTIRVPENAPAGDYSGKIQLTSAGSSLGELQLSLRVLPLQLAGPYLDYSIYYRGVLKDTGSISSEHKNQTQFTAEMQDLAGHGVLNPTVYPADSLSRLGTILTIRNQAGMNGQPLYYIGSPATFGSDTTFKNHVRSYGVTDIYLYGIDEGSAAANAPLINDYHNRGYKAFVALNASNADALASTLDLAIVSSLNKSLADKYHSYGHKIYAYGIPQLIAEYPRTYRLNYGLRLWQNNYDGVMGYAYQHSYGDIWNDFDDTILRDHVFAYPTMNGVIDTVQWEGFREGVDDIRYLTTLQNAIRDAKAAGKSTLSAESWLSNLKNSNLSGQDLDAIRAQMVSYILSLSGLE